MYDLVVPFDTDDPEFVRGFELGALYAKLSEDHTPVTATLHATNAEMIIRLAEAMGYTYSAEEPAEGWVYVTLNK